MYELRKVPMESVHQNDGAVPQYFDRHTVNVSIPLTFD